MNYWIRVLIHRFINACFLFAFHKHFKFFFSPVCRCHRQTYPCCGPPLLHTSSLTSWSLANLMNTWLILWNKVWNKRKELEMNTLASWVQGRYFPFYILKADLILVEREMHSNGDYWKINLSILLHLVFIFFTQFTFQIFFNLIQKGNSTLSLSEMASLITIEWYQLRPHDDDLIMIMTTS